MRPYAALSFCSEWDTSVEFASGRRVRVRRDAAVPAARCGLDRSGRLHGGFCRDTARRAWSWLRCVMLLGVDAERSLALPRRQPRGGAAGLLPSPGLASGRRRGDARAAQEGESAGAR